jgi:hypothetical protein
MWIILLTSIEMIGKGNYLPNISCSLSSAFLILFLFISEECGLLIHVGGIPSGQYQTMGLLCVICAVYLEDLIYGSNKGEDVFSGRKRKNVLLG